MDRIHARVFDLVRPFHGLAEHGWLWNTPGGWRYSCMLNAAAPPAPEEVLFLEIADGRCGPMKVAFVDAGNSAVEFEGLGPLLMMAHARPFVVECRQLIDRIVRFPRRSATRRHQFEQAR